MCLGTKMAKKSPTLVQFHKTILLTLLERRWQQNPLNLQKKASVSLVNLFLLEAREWRVSTTKSFPTKLASTSRSGGQRLSNRILGMVVNIWFSLIMAQLGTLTPRSLQRHTLTTMCLMGELKQKQNHPPPFGRSP